VLNLKIEKRDLEALIACLKSRSRAVVGEERMAINRILRDAESNLTPVNERSYEKPKN
jgi:hypothetical protein